MALRLHVTGESALHQDFHSRYDQIVDDLRAIINNHGQGQIWFENLKLATKAPRTKLFDATQDRDVTGDSPGDDPWSAIEAVINEAREDAGLRQELTETLKRYWNRLPKELVNHPEAPIRCDDKDQLNEWLDAAGPILRSSIESVESAR